MALCDRQISTRDANGNFREIKFKDLGFLSREETEDLIQEKIEEYVPEDLGDLVYTETSRTVSPFVLTDGYNKIRIYRTDSVVFSSESGSTLTLNFNNSNIPSNEGFI